MIALGGNLPSAAYGPPQATLEAALALLPSHGIALLKRSRWYETSPVPPSGQPWFVNGAAVVETSLPPQALLAALLEIEARLGRVRGARWDARIADLDLLAYGGRVQGEEAGNDLVLPHPRLHLRRFVLEPLAEIAPDWRHPVLGRTPGELLAALDAPDIVRPL